MKVRGFSLCYGSAIEKVAYHGFGCRISALQLWCNCQSLNHRSLLARFEGRRGTLHIYAHLVFLFLHIVLATLQKHDPNLLKIPSLNLQVVQPKIMETQLENVWNILKTQHLAYHSDYNFHITQPCFECFRSDSWHQAALRFHDVPFSSAIAAEAACRIEGASNGLCLKLQFCSIGFFGGKKQDPPMYKCQQNDILCSGFPCITAMGHGFYTLFLLGVLELHQFGPGRLWSSGSLGHSLGLGTAGLVGAGLLRCHGGGRSKASGGIRSSKFGEKNVSLGVLGSLIMLLGGFL